MKRVVKKRCDLFCGAGGFSTGGDIAFREAGLEWDGIAINHWNVAVGTYNANHPHMKALCMGVEDAIPSKLFPGREIDYLVASPTCTHFSRARGGRPRSDQQRSQPFLIVTWLAENFVRHLTVENVPEFIKWGPLNKDGKPIKRLEGTLFQQWVEAIKSCNYDVEWRIVCCADYGDATTRRRFFLKAVRKGCGRIRWPEPTHAKNPEPDLWGRTLKKWRGIGECIDKTDTGKSIFGRDRPLAMNTLRRIFVGMEKYNGIGFQMDMLGADKGDASRVRPLSSPLPPQHAGGNRTAVVRPFVVRLNRNCDVESVEEPLSTVTANGQHHILCTPFIMDYFGLKHDHEFHVKSMDEPLPTVTTEPHHYLCQPFIVNNNANNVPKPLDKPAPALTTGNHAMLCTPLVLDHCRNGKATDGKEPMGAQTTHDRYSVVTPLVLGQQSGAAARPVDEPCPTIATGGAVQLATPLIIDMSRPGGHDSGHVHSADEPIQTITSCDAVQVATPVIVDGVDVRNLPRLPDGRYLDIRIRMLKPSELAAAHSFPPDYVFTGNRTEQVKQIGNSVPVMTAAAMCRADLEAS